MRIPRTLTALLALSLLLTTAVGLAVAAPGDDSAASDSKRPANSHDQAAAKHDEARAEHADARASHAEAKDARLAAKDSFRADHKRIVSDWHDARHDARASYVENKTRIMEECNAMDTDNHSEIAACKRDGLQPLRDQYHDALKDSRLAAKANLVEIFEAKLTALRAAFGLTHHKERSEPVAADATETTTDTNTSS